MPVGVKKRRNALGELIELIISVAYDVPPTTKFPDESISKVYHLVT
jgi:hypothetical protein